MPVHACTWLFRLWVAAVPAIVQACLWYLYLALQEVSGYYVLPYFMPAHDAYSWLSRLWVATLPCNISCLLMMPILGSSESEWPLCLAIFCACSPVLGSPVCEWLLFPAIFHACSWCLFLALQPVSSYFALQYFMPAHDACSWLSSQWVATLPCNISCLLMMLVLGSPASEWLFALQYFMPAHNACSWLSREWVATLPCNISCLLMMPILGSPESEWLLYLAIFHACSLMPILGSPVCEWYFALQYFMPAHDACSWLSSWWVATLPCNV